MKYIILEHTEPNTDVISVYPVIFPKGLIHNDIADAIIAIVKEKYKDTLVCVSAGDVVCGVSSASGKSETLGIEAREMDKGLINSIDYIQFRTKESAPVEDDGIKHQYFELAIMKPNINQMCYCVDNDGIERVGTYNGEVFNDWENKIVGCVVWRP